MSSADQISSIHTEYAQWQASGVDPTTIKRRFRERWNEVQTSDIPLAGAISSLLSQIDQEDVYNAHKAEEINAHALAKKWKVKGKNPLLIKEELLKRWHDVQTTNISEASEISQVLSYLDRQIAKATAKKNKLIYGH